MDYEEQYKQLMESKKDRVFDESETYEKHHIWPTSIGGKDVDENIVFLTPKEHYIAHWLLYKSAAGWWDFLQKKHREKAYSSWKY